MTDSKESISENLPVEPSNPIIISCPSCQKQQDSNNKFCESCGQNFNSEKLKSKQIIKKNIRKVKDKRENRKNHTHVNDGRILIMVVAIASFALYLLKADYIDELILNIISESENLNLINYYKMLSYIPLGIGTIYLGLFFYSFKNIFSSLIISFSIFLIETGLVVFLSGVKLHPLYLIYKGVVITFLILAIKASLKLRVAAKKQVEP